MTQQGYGSNLGRYASLMRDPDERGPHRMAARKWHEDGSIIITAESKARLDWQDRDLLDAICARLYGPREAE